MTITEKLKVEFSKYEIGTEFTTAEIIDRMKTNYGANDESIKPSDYCYNITNKDKIKNSSIKDFYIFEFLSRGKYKYLGVNYPYEGVVLNAQKEVYGHWKNGVFFKK